MPYAPEWAKRVAEANMSGEGFSSMDRQDARDWETCAVGEAFHAIGLNPNSEKILIPGIFRAGVNFMDAVQNNHIEEANECLDDIEKAVDAYIAGKGV